jgi:hypothetical protein
VDGNQVEKLNTKTDSTISALVYPYWHPEENSSPFQRTGLSRPFTTMATIGSKSMTRLRTSCYTIRNRTEFRGRN